MIVIKAIRIFSALMGLRVELYFSSALNVSVAMRLPLANDKQVEVKWAIPAEALGDSMWLTISLCHGDCQCFKQKPLCHPGS